MYGMSVFALVAGFVIVICILKMQIRQAGLTHRFCLVAVVFATVATAIWLPVPTAAAAVGLVVGIIGGYLLFWWGGKDLD